MFSNHWPFIRETFSHDWKAEFTPDKKTRAITATFSQGVAPCFGDLECESFKTMDRALVDALQRAVDYLEAKQASNELHDVPWDMILSIFLQSQFLRPVDHQAVSESRYFSAHDDRVESSFWRRPFQSRADRAAKVEEFMIQKQMRIRCEAKAWFHGLVNKDRDVFEKALHVGHISEAIEAVSLLDPDQRDDGDQGRRETEKCFVDVGVLRIPDISVPYVQLYRIKLTAHTAHTVKSMDVRSGITGGMFVTGQRTDTDADPVALEYMCRRFEPRPAVMERLLPQCIKAGEMGDDALLARANSPVWGY